MQRPKTPAEAGRPPPPNKDGRTTVSHGFLGSLLEGGKGVQRQSPLYKGYFYDFVIVFPNVEGGKEASLLSLIDRKDPAVFNEKRREILSVLRDAGFELRKSRSRDRKEIYVRLGTSEGWLQEKAERSKFMKDLSKRYQEAYQKTEAFSDANWAVSEPFTREGLKAGRYAPGDSGSAFTSGERIRLVEAVLEQERSLGGCEIPFSEFLKHQWILKYFPLHEETTRQQLLDEFAKKWWWPWQRHVPLNKIRDYFGESVAMYFSFLLTYTRWLFYVMVVGIVVAVFQFTDHWPPMPVKDPDTGIVKEKVLKSYDGPAIPVYCIFLAVAATYFLTHWKRTESTNEFIWDMHELDKRPIPRPDFRGEEKVGIYTQQTDWVDLEKHFEWSDIQKRYRRPQYTTKYAPRQWAWILSAYVIGVCALVVVCAAALSLLFFREYLYWSDDTRGPLYASIFAGPAFVITIRVLDFVYLWIARKVTDRENHRYHSDYESALIRKVFVFQFVNNYIAYYYIAFYKNFQLDWLGSRQRCLPVEEGAPPNCMYELQRQLSSVFVFQIVAGNIIEVLMPRIRACFVSGGVKNLDAVLAGKSAISWVEFQSRNMDVFTSLFDDYNELIIQFGYVTLFATGFPLAAFFAFLNNVLEVRTDAYKYLTAYQRPYIRGAKNIGMWYTVLEIQSNIAIVTNVLILCFVSTTVDELFVQAGIPFGRFWKLFTVVAVEHLIFLVKSWITRTIPDATARVRKEIAIRKAKAAWDKDLQHEKALIASGRRPAASLSATLASAVSTSGYRSPATEEE